MGALLALTLWAYAPLRSAGFTYEDAKWIDQLGQHAETSLTLTSQLFGASPWAFHLGNVLLHSVNGLLLYASAMIVYGSTIGLLATMIFLLHPLNSEAVNAIANRPELLSAFWLLLAIWIIVAQNTQPLVRSLAIVACAGLAMHAKASGIVVLGLIPFVILITRHHELWRWIGPLWVLTIAAVSQRALGVWTNPYTFGSALSTWHYLGAQSVALFVLLSQVLAPAHLSIDPDWEAASTLAQCGCGMLLVVACAWMLREKSVVLGWIALCVWPRFIVRPPELLHFHHGYLPMIGIALGLASLVSCYLPTESPCAA